MKNENRWKQRLSNFQNVFSVFQRRINEYRLHPSEEAYQMSLIQSFEILFELSWKTLKDFLEYQGHADINSPKQIIRQAFQDGLIHDPEIWMRALEVRNETTHVYDPVIMEEVLTFIADQFNKIVQDFDKKFL